VKQGAVRESGVILVPNLPLLITRALVISDIVHEDPITRLNPHAIICKKKKTTIKKIEKKKPYLSLIGLLNG